MVLHQVHGGEKFYENSSGGDVEGCGEAVSVEEDFLGLEPCIKGRVALELPKGFGGIDPYMEVDGCHVFFACSVIGSVIPFTYVLRSSPTGISVSFVSGLALDVLSMGRMVLLGLIF